MESTSKSAEKKSINFRELDDLECSNIVIARQIRRLVKKFPSLQESVINCWVHGGHYTKFKFDDNKFVWFCNEKEPYLKGYEKITNECRDLYKDELNKLLVFTHDALCSSCTPTELADTPEDLLSLAETKLQEMLNDNDLD